MKPEEVKLWLEKEAKKKNTLAETYLLMLQDATPEMQSHWFGQLGAALQAIEMIKPELNKSTRNDS